MIANVLKSSFALKNEKNEISPMIVSVGEDQSFVSYAEVNKLTSFNTAEGRRIDFLKIDTIALMSAIGAALGLPVESGIEEMENCKVEGRYLRKISEKEYLFSWNFRMPKNILEPQVKSGYLNYLVYTVLNESLEFEVERYIEINEKNKFLRGAGLFDENGTRYYYEPISVRQNNSNAESSIKPEQSLGKKNEIIDSSDGEELKDVSLDRLLRSEFKDMTLLHKVTPANKTFSITTDTINIQWSWLNEILLLDCSSLAQSGFVFFEISKILTEKGDVTKFEKLAHSEVQAHRGRAWKDWGFLGYSILNKDSIFYDPGAINACMPKSIIEIIRISKTEVDTFGLKSYLPMFLIDVVTTKDGKLHLLTRSRFSESNFGSQVHILKDDNLFPVAYYDSMNMDIYDDFNKNKDLVSFISHIEIESLEDLELSNYSRTTRCDISGFKSMKNNFKAYLQHGNEVLGNIEIGIYTLEELRQDPTGFDSKEDASVYILINGYVFKYDTKSKVFWIGDGTKLKNIKNMNAAVDVAVRCFLSLQYNVEHSKLICFD